MITADITKQQFVVQILERDVKNIFSAQLLIATKNIYTEGTQLRTRQRSGITLSEKSSFKLLPSLQNPKYDIRIAEGRLMMTVKIAKQLRFYDMKAHGDWGIYNRQVWGILYNNALRDIRSNYGNELHDELGKVLREQLDYSGFASRK
jgi:hypothetical protein